MQFFPEAYQDRPISQSNSSSIKPYSNQIRAKIIGASSDRIIDLTKNKKKLNTDRPRKIKEPPKGVSEADNCKSFVKTENVPILLII